MCTYRHHPVFICVCAFRGGDHIKGRKYREIFLQVSGMLKTGSKRHKFIYRSDVDKYTQKGCHQNGYATCLKYQSKPLD